MCSRLFRVNRKDLINGLLIAFLTALLTGIVELLQGGKILDWVSLKPVLVAAVCAAISYLIKCFGTNSQNQLLTAEPYK